MNIQEKLYTIRYNIDSENPHIVVDQEKCKHCADTPCLFVCPVEAYTLDEEEIALSWQDCMECGTCRITCPLGAIDWSFPRGGFGVCFRYG
jgi:ferredoxin like protein